MAAHVPPQDSPRIREGHSGGTDRPTFSVVEVLKETWNVYTGSLGRFFLMAAIVFGLLSALQYLTQESGEFGVLALFMVVSVVGVFWLQGAFVVAVDHARRRAPMPSIFDLFKRVLPQLWPLVGAGIVVLISVMIGLALLVIPGLALLTIWSMTAPAIVLEGKSVRESLSRSWHLVQGDALRVFTVIVITFVIATAFSGVVTGILQPLPSGVRFYIVSVVASAIAAPFVTIAWAVTYFELKFNKEFVRRR
jgi:membrane-anchored glycerophosphoryl diester phosphodiesterase (GDPDase)